MRPLPPRSFTTRPIRFSAGLPGPISYAAYSTYAFSVVFHILCPDKTCPIVGVQMPFLSVDGP